MSRKGLGVAPYCLPDKALADPVTHADLEQALRPYREAIYLMAERLGHELGRDDIRRILDLFEARETTIVAKVKP